jgi:hypothetical protein
VNFYIFLTFFVLKFITVDKKQFPVIVKNHQNFQGYFSIEFEFKLSMEMNLSESSVILLSTEKILDGAQFWKQAGGVSSKFRIAGLVTSLNKVNMIVRFPTLKKGAIVGKNFRVEADQHYRVIFGKFIREKCNVMGSIRWENLELFISL